MIGPSRPLTDGPGELDGVLCRHRTPSRGTPGPGGVTDSGPIGLPPGGMDDGLEESSAASGGGSDGGTGGVPGLTRTPTATSNKDRGLADSAAIYSQWEGAWGTGMAQRLLPAVWPSSPGPPNTLQWLPGQVLHQSRP